MKNLALCNKTVRVNDEGLVSLTDMWKASGQFSSKEPRKFLALTDTETFITELNRQNLGGLEIRRGKFGGTWACKYIAYKYAGWIDKAFEVGSFKVLDKYFTGELIYKPQQELHDFAKKACISEEKGSFHGKGLNQRKREKKVLDKEAAALLVKYQNQLPI